MQFEKIRRINKNKIIVGGVIALGVIGAITILPSFAKYKLTESIKIGEGVVNYKVPDLKVMAMYKSDNGTNYTEITSMPSSGYVINEKKTYCTTDNVNQVKGKIRTVNGEITLKNLTKSDKCYLYFDKIKITDSTSLVANSKINIGSPDFSKTATTDEGIYATYDNLYGGQSYYWRGATTTNYVKFAGFCWRIIRINGDGTMRLIYDGTTCHDNGTNTAESIAKTGIAYNSSYNNSSYVGWTYTASSQRPSGAGTASNAKTQLESWYSANITGTNATKVADGKYCNDRNVGQPYSGWSGYITTWSAAGTQFAYAGVDRLWNKYTPTLSCSSGDVYTLKVGLITADEVELAGGTNENNTSYYLYNGQNYWTMSPNQWNGAGAIVFLVRTSGLLGADAVHSAILGLRPVINLKADTLFKEGTNGTQNNPYEII